MKIINFFLITLFFVLNIAISQDGNTPTNLTIDAASVGGVQLSWDTPENFSRTWITHSNNIFQWGIRETSGNPVFYGQKFPDSLLNQNIMECLLKNLLLFQQIRFNISTISI